MKLAGAQCTWCYLSTPQWVATGRAVWGLWVRSSIVLWLRQESGIVCMLDYKRCRHLGSFLLQPQRRPESGGGLHWGRDIRHLHGPRRPDVPVRHWDRLRADITTDLWCPDTITTRPPRVSPATAPSLVTSGTGSQCTASVKFRESRSEAATGQDNESIQSVTNGNIEAEGWRRGLQCVGLLLRGGRGLWPGQG